MVIKSQVLRKGAVKQDNILAPSRLTLGQETASVLNLGKDMEVNSGKVLPHDVGSSSTKTAGGDLGNPKEPQRFSIQIQGKTLTNLQWNSANGCQDILERSNLNELRILLTRQLGDSCDGCASGIMIQKKKRFQDKHLEFRSRWDANASDLAFEVLYLSLRFEYSSAKEGYVVCFEPYRLFDTSSG
ncbi:hypothetical protein BT96DRAFT_939123 [Gymnopus androsaceus JB14]|uniref:Uncharacterized protein n=1 Tax=Gymnopus androsaceus JB14 TaxID=1447944 RepID=A0A6A4HNY2_9AGAR|nr:hypothetical protein BT96DRAFT_939123 [Gymnopus androsaceus JB14]